MQSRRNSLTAFFYLTSHIHYSEDFDMSIKKIFTFTLILTIAFTTFSCTNDNKEYEEYYHPMGNNPVQVVPWLKRVKKSFLGKDARISLYKLDEKEYYTAQVIISTESSVTSPYTIYEAFDEEAIILFHSDDILKPDQDTLYNYFIENADLVNVLWSNENKYSPFEF